MSAEALSSSMICMDGLISDCNKAKLDCLIILVASDHMTVLDVELEN